MKFQPAKLVIIALVAVMSLSVFGSVAAQGTTEPNDPCAPTSISAQVNCNPNPPVDPCAPTSISAMGNPCNPPPPPVDPCANVQTSFPFKVATMACESPVEEPVVPVPAAPAPVVNYEENVSFNDTDLGVTLLKTEDANGSPQMDLFHTNTGTTTTTFLFSITQNDIAPFMAELPAENTLLASAEGVSVYVLTTGEIQVNAGPDAEGKYHVKIFDGIPWTRVYGYTIDPVK